MSIYLRAVAFALLIAVTCAPARGEPSLDAGGVAEAVARLQPGEYLWAPQLAPGGPVLVIVNRATQRLVVYRNGVPIGISTVSTGRPGYRTPTGVFTILQKREEHYSSTYDNAPMPFMQRLTWRGVALHAGQLPGYPASHGCIRLPRDFARLLFGVTEVGMTVVITDSARLPAVAPEPALLLVQSRGTRPAATPVWRPERSPRGPVSIVLSGADRRIVVLRNGIAIGSAPVEIDRPIIRAEAFVLRALEPAGPQWLRLPLPGQDAGEPVRPEDRQHYRVPEVFRAAVRSALQPGATLIVTPDALGVGGDPVTLLEAELRAPL